MFYAIECIFLEKFFKMQFNAIFWISCNSIQFHFKKHEIAIKILII